MNKDALIEYTPEGYQRLYDYITFLPEEQKKVLMPVIIGCFVTF